MAIPSEAEYERRELHNAYQKLVDVKNLPLAERKENKAELFEAMQKHPGIIAERIGWLLDGNYGYGERLQALRILKSPRMNREAALTQLIASHEWMVPADMTMAAWKKLTAAEKKKLDKLVKKEIRDAEEMGWT